MHTKHLPDWLFGCVVFGKTKREVDNLVEQIFVCFEHSQGQRDTIPRADLHTTLRTILFTQAKSVEDASLPGINLKNLRATHGKLLVKLDENLKGLEIYEARCDTSDSESEDEDTKMEAHYARVAADRKRRRENQIFFEVNGRNVRVVPNPHK